MPIPFFYHAGNCGGNSFYRAVGAMRGTDDILLINDEADFERARPRLTPDFVPRLTIAIGHAIHLADPWFPERYEMTMIRWPLAVFCADNVYAYEHPPYAVPEIFGLDDHHERLRAYLDHLEGGGVPIQRTLINWFRARHELHCPPNPMRAQRMAVVEQLDGIIRDHYDLVGITEFMDETLFLFQADFPHWPVTPWVRNTVNKQRIDAFKLPPDIVERFEREYEADLILYNRARRRLLDRFAAFWRDRVDLREYYLTFKTAMILTDPQLMARFAEGSPLYFPPELPVEELRARVIAQLDRAHEIRAKILRAYG
jgi:hypothetical protein